MPKRGWDDFEPIEINQIWGSYGKTTIQSYNKLLCSEFFYQIFHNYDFILIAQLDTYIFHNQIGQFTNKNYDYWGAPWFMDLYLTYPYLRDLISPPIFPRLWHRIRRKYFPSTIRRYVGNGGLSLRRVSAFIEACRKYQHVYEKFEVRIRNWAQLGYDISYEDNFWCLFFPKMAAGIIRIAPWREALQFSFETAPSLAYRLNGNNLPFGTHAWFKHEKEFWRPFIREWR
ncbi:MAG: hypothetical protein NZM26_02420 [Patescibacteria group bacterium]|nr:hypothetical protein [Patescibacteria group bacterium]